MAVDKARRFGGLQTCDAGITDGGGMEHDAASFLDRLDQVELFPAERLQVLQDAISKQLASMGDDIRELAKLNPVLGFTLNPLWIEAKWSATTFQWHPKSEAPPIMGIVFDDAAAGRAIFREMADYYNHSDRFEELRISIIEGSPHGQRPGYSVHLGPDPESLAASSTAEDFVLDPKFLSLIGRWNRMYPVPGSPPMLRRFKEEFNKHKEFLLVPVTRRKDGQNYADVDLGIIKSCIQFCDLSEITADDIDAMALKLPELILPRA
jgi:hypothetical protein